MEKETEKLNSNIEKMLQALEKAQDSIAENIDNLLVQMGEVEASIAELKRLIGAKSSAPVTVDDDAIEDDEEAPNALDELKDFDADDDLSDDDLKRMGYDIK